MGAKLRERRKGMKKRSQLNAHSITAECVATPLRSEAFFLRALATNDVTLIRLFELASFHLHAASLEVWGTPGDYLTPAPIFLTLFVLPRCGRFIFTLGPSLLASLSAVLPIISHRATEARRGTYTEGFTCFDYQLSRVEIAR